MKINVHIERLVFDGLSVASGEAALVQAAVEVELGRLLASELFAPASAFAEAHVAAGEIHIHPGRTAGDLGVEIGRSVFRGLTQSRFGLREQAERSPRGRFQRSVRGRGFPNFYELFNSKTEVDQGTTSDPAQVRISGPTQTNNQRR